MLSLTEDSVWSLSCCLFYSSGVGLIKILLRNLSWKGQARLSGSPNKGISLSFTTCVLHISRAHFLLVSFPHTSRTKCFWGHSPHMFRAMCSWGHSPHLARAHTLLGLSPQTSRGHSHQMSRVYVLLGSFPSHIQGMFTSEVIPLTHPGHMCSWGHFPHTSRDHLPHK